MLLADNDFGGLDVFADSGSQWHFTGSFPGKLEYLYVLGPVVGCHRILIPGSGDVVSLKNGERNQIAIGYEDFGVAIAGRPYELLECAIEPVSDGCSIPIDQTETVSLDVGHQPGLPDFPGQSIHRRAVDLVQVSVSCHGSEASRAE